MKKTFIPTVFILLVIFVTLGIVGAQASLNSTSTTKSSVTAASLNFEVNGDVENGLRLDLGQVKPGDSGVVNITINSSGSVASNLCITEGDKYLPSEFIVTPQPNMCGVTVAPNSSTQFQINWSLPFTAHGTEIDGDEFYFSYSFTLEGGFKITKTLFLIGIFSDPADTPTPTPTETEEPTETETPTDEPTEKPTEEATEDSTEEPTEEVPTETPTEDPTQDPTDESTVEPTEESTETPTDEPTEEIPTEEPTEEPIPTETPVPTDIPTEEPTQEPIEVPTEVPTEEPIDEPTQEPTDVP